MNEINAILTIAYRDLAKFLQDRSRILATFVFPFIFVGILGRSMQSGLGDQTNFNFLVYTFTGVLAQTLFQSSATGVISLIEDREQDFSQEIFVSPISRYSIIIGKILGEATVAIMQFVGVVLFGFLIGASVSLTQFITLLPIAVLLTFFGGSFGVLILSNLSSQRAVNQIFPFIILPQFFLAGVFSPIQDLPPYLMVLSRLAPMTYAVDLLRNIYYYGQPELSAVTLHPLWLNLSVIIGGSLIFLILGTWLFVRKEQNR